MLTDAVLVDRVIAGFDGAFDELYRRHANAAWRLGQAVTGNSHDAADAVSEAFARVLQAVKAGKLQNGDAFRSYLLTATRNAALDGLRKQGKASPTDDEKLGELPTDAPSPADKLEGAEDAVLVSQAFRNLPERWRSVLWLTEVEGVATKDAADQLGLSANGTAQLALRARAGLRERFLQAHVKDGGEVPSRCRFTVDHLGAYVGGGISPRDLAKVDQHLADCAGCRARKEQLEELGSTLRRVALPIPLALGALSFDRVQAALAASSDPSGPLGFVTRATQLAKEPTPGMRKLAGSAAAGVLAVALLSLGFVGDADGPVAGLAAPKGKVQPASVDLPEATISDSYSFPSGSFTSGGAAFAMPSTGGRTAFSAPGTGGTTPLATASPTTPRPLATTQEQPAATKPAEPSPLTPLCGLANVLCGNTGGTPTPPLPEVPVNIGVNLGGTPIGIGLGAGTAPPTAGVTVGETDVVSPAPVPPPTEPGANLQVGPVTVPVPLPDLGLGGLGL